MHTTTMNGRAQTSEGPGTRSDQICGDGPTGGIPEAPPQPSSDFPVKETGKGGRPQPGKDERSRNPERQAAFLESMLRAFSRRCETEAPDLGLASLWQRERELHRYMERQVLALRRETPRWTWEQIGSLVGLTAQGAWARWGKPAGEARDA